MRRNLLKGELFLLLFSFMLPLKGIVAQQMNLLNPLSQQKFINQLPLPGVLQPETEGGNYYEVTISQFMQHLGLYDSNEQPLMTKVWGYDGSYPGPTIEAYKNIPITVRWENELVGDSPNLLGHLFPIDESLHWAAPTTGIPIVTHLHGGHTEAASDGNPEAWYTPNFAETGDNFVKENYTYANDQEATTLWYHDHVLGITRLNVYAGLAGFYLLRSEEEESLELPSGDYEIPLVIQDRLFYEDGSLYYPTETELLEEPLEEEEEAFPGEATILPEMFGDFILVNGMVWPYLNVEPRKYRLRMLNGSDSRFYQLSIPGMPFYQIGSDGGLLNAPVRSSKLIIGPGERLDVVVDFSNPALLGQTIIMKNTARSPYPFGDTPNPNTTGQIMAFKVVLPLAAPDTSKLPATLRPSPIQPLAESSETRKLILFEGEDEFGRLKPLLGTASQGPLDYEEAITENPMTGSVEEWEIYNTTPDAHPIHLHLVHFQVINTQKFNVRKYEPGDESSLQLLGQPRPPGPENAGWKDTYIVQPGEVARVKALFDKEGLYVWHCHILSHEDHNMMRPFYVGNIPAESLIAGTAQLEEPLEDRLNHNSMVKENVLIIAPNPVESMASIRFNLREDTRVSLQIYDFMGRLVAIPYQGYAISSQDYEVRIDRERLRSGQYLCKLTTDSGKSYEKWMIVR